MEMIFTVFIRRLNVTSSVDNIFVESISYLLRFSYTNMIIKNSGWSNVCDFFEEINLFVTFHVIFKSRRLLGK